MAGYYEFRTRAGAFRIVPHGGGWVAMFEAELLSPAYQTAQHALDDLAGGHTDWPSCGDPSLLGIPEDLSDWRSLRSS